MEFIKDTPEYSIARAVSTAKHNGLDYSKALLEGESENERCLNLVSPEKVEEITTFIYNTGK